MTHLSKFCSGKLAGIQVVHVFQGYVSLQHEIFISLDIEMVTACLGHIACLLNSKKPPTCFLTCPIVFKLHFKPISLPV